MKLIIEATNVSDTSELGTGRVFVGKTGKGTPVAVLVSGIKPATDAVEAFEREWDALPELDYPDAPQSFEQAVEQRVARVDLNLIVATWMCAYGDGKEEVDPADFAKHLAQTMPGEHPRHYERLIGAANAVARLLVGAIAKSPLVHEEVGHA